jgi:hypothetical protein
MNTHPCTDSTVVEIDVPSARVDVSAVDSHEVGIDVAPLFAWRPADHRAADRVTVSASEERIGVTAPQVGLGDLGTVIVTVTVPRATAVHVRTGNGRIRLMGRTGPAQLHTANGSIEAEEAAGLDAWTKNGSIRIQRATGQVRAGSRNGAIKVGTSDGDVALESTNGAIKVASAVGGRLSAETAHGKIAVGVPENVSAWVDASTRHGRVDNRLTPGDGPAAERTVELRLLTGSGSVVLDRPRPIGD